MRKIGVRQFKDEFYAQIKELPLLVTSHDKPLIVVTFPGHTPKEVVTKMELSNALKEPKTRKKAKPAFTEDDFHTCSWNKSFKCKSPGTVKVKSRWFCPPHSTS